MRKVVWRKPAEGWTASGPGWCRRVGPWELRIGADIAGSRGWMVLLDGQVLGVGHGASLEQAKARALQEQVMLSGGGSGPGRRHRAEHPARPAV